MEMFPPEAQLAVAASLHFKDYTRNNYIIEFLITDEYSQYYTFTHKLKIMIVFCGNLCQHFSFDIDSQCIS